MYFFPSLNLLTPHLCDGRQLYGLFIFLYILEQRYWLNFVSDYFFKEFCRVNRWPRDDVLFLQSKEQTHLLPTIREDSGFLISGSLSCNETYCMCKYSLALFAKLCRSWYEDQWKMTIQWLMLLLCLINCLFLWPRRLMSSTSWLVYKVKSRILHSSWRMQVISFV